MEYKEDVHCGESGCEKNVTLFCTQCKKLLCDMCAKDHDRMNPKHHRTKLSVDKQNCLKVKCTVHPKAMCDYICCKNTLVCFYCINRKHYGHHYDTVEHHIERLKEKLQNEIERFETVSKTVNNANESIQVCREQFEECLKYRKMSNLSQYINLLEREETELRKGFNDICSLHQREYGTAESIAQCKEYIEYTDVQMALLQTEILDSIKGEQCPLMRLSRTISFWEGTYLTLHPLGELQVTEEQVAFTNTAPSIHLYAPENKKDGMLQELSKKLDELVRAVKLTTRLGATIGGNDSASREKITNYGRKTVVAQIKSNPNGFAQTKSRSDVVAQKKTISDNLVQKKSKGDIVVQKKPLSNIEAQKKSISNNDPQKKSNTNVESRKKSEADVTQQNPKQDALRQRKVKPLTKQPSLDKETLIAMGDYKKMADGKKFEYFGTLMKMKNDKLCMHLISENPTAAVSRKNNHNSTLLHFAAASDRVDVVKHLIKNGADINAVNNAGYCVLHFASYNNSVNCIRYISSTYPHILDIKSNKKLTPYEFAVNFKCNGAIRAFKDSVPKEMLQ